MATKMRKLIPVTVIAATFSLTFLLPGCTGITFQSGDALKGIYSARVAAVRQKYGSPQGLADELGKVHDGESRNQVLNDFLFLIDSNYMFWEKNLYNKKSFSDFGADVTATSLSTLSGIVSGAGVQGAKSILSFVAGGITSTKASFSSDILQSQSLLTMIAKMREQRSAKLIALQKGMYQSQSTTPTDLSAYSLDQGLIDLAAYYQAGTFVSAFQDIIDKAGKDKSESDSQLKDMKGIKETPIKK